jgi:RNA polymerase sigma-70 factor (ECF subfamily)
MHKTDEDLISDFQSGEIAAFNELFQRYKNPIFNFALRILNNRADAEDVTSEVFMNLFEKKHMFQPIAKFKTWIFKIAHNACMSTFRKAKRMRSMWFFKKDEGSYVQRDIPDPADIPSEQMKKEEDRRRIQAAIAHLPDAQKGALILREYHAMNYAQIAEVMECSLQNVKVLIYRARNALRDQLSV